MKSLTRAVATVAAAVTVAFGVTVPAAEAQGNVNLVIGSSDSARDLVWNARNSMMPLAKVLPFPMSDHFKEFVDNTANAIAPGVVAEHNAASREAARLAASAARARINFDAGNCPAWAKACVDLDGERAWLQENGRVIFGPVPMSSGAPGWETPRGSFHVVRKVKDEISWVFNNAPMPYSTYFTHDGVAFHAGDPDVWSHGCIHLRYDDAVLFYSQLNMGDSVVVY